MVARFQSALALTSIVLQAQAQISTLFENDLRRKLPHEDEGFMLEELVHADEYGEWVHEPEAQQMIRGRRNLDVLYTTQDSFKCRQCITSNNVFCLNSTHNSGTCCLNKTGCNEIDACSYMVPQDSFGLKYWSCPNDLSICGSKSFLVASQDVIEQELRPKGDYKNVWNDGQLCHYRIVFPQGSAEFDQILITLEERDRVNVLLTETETFRAQKYTELSMKTGVTYAVDWPNEAFLLVMSNEGTIPSDYRLTYRFNDRDPDTVIANMSIEERDAYLNTRTKVVDEGVAETDTFWFFVGGGILGAIIIIALVYCMIVVKRRNDVMVAKVEKMTAEQLAEKDFIPDDEANDDFYTSQRKAAQEKAEKAKLEAASAQPTALPFAKKGPAMQDEQDGPVLKMKTADVGKAIVAPPKVDVVKSDNVSENPSSRKSWDQPITQAVASSASAATAVRANNGGRNDASQAQVTPQTQAEKEAEKFRKMQQLLKQGGAEVPKRTVQGMINPSPSPERRATIGRAVNAAGFNSIDVPEPAVVRRMTLVSTTANVVDYGDSNKNKDPTSSMPAPVQSRVVFQGAGMGLPGINNASNPGSLELPAIGRRGL